MRSPSRHAHAPSDVAFGNGNAALLLPSDTELPALKFLHAGGVRRAGDIALCTLMEILEQPRCCSMRIGGTVFALAPWVHVREAEEYRDWL